MPKPLTALEKKLGVTFKNKETLRIALTHRSYLNENGNLTHEHNERLEFLGDAVLELLVSKYLFQHYQQKTEGELTSFRAATVRTESLAKTAGKLGVGEFIFMSKGEEATGGRAREYLLANTFEAIIGAIYIDQGLEKAGEFLVKKLFPKISDIVEKRLDIDNKSNLQEIAQEQVRITPTYDLVGESGPAHDKEFIMKVMIGKHKFGEGKGHSKQEAEQQAAENALSNWDDLIEKYYPEAA